MLEISNILSSSVFVTFCIQTEKTNIEDVIHTRDKRKKYNKDRKCYWNKKKTHFRTDILSNARMKGAILLLPDNKFFVVKTLNC